MTQTGNGAKVAWFLTGALLGGACALFAAPYSGKRMRRMVSECVEDSVHSMIDAGHELQQQGKRFAKGAADLVERARIAVSA